ncbi:MAG: DNA/RNA non-specific endonuclease [Candidatus Riflebacteria bacterium]|jgi:endonuclease G|nr:DNA/RNA non-specific endonuclease [Candidatus Riflebacteria bacterium]
MIKSFRDNRRGSLGPTQLIAIILLLTLVGLGVYYYLQRQVEKPGKVYTPSGFFQVDEDLRAATQRAGNVVYGGNPRLASSTTVTLLKNIAYHAGYCEERRNPLWVAYRLDTIEHGEKLKRPKGFKADMRTLSRVSPGDFVKSGYDRGHLAPNSAIAQRYGLDAQHQTFLMSNIVPQTPDLNRKVWQRLEKMEDEYANRLENVWVITGPIFDEHIQQISNNIEIPDAFFKILFDEEKGNVRAMAFLLQQNVTGKEPLESFLTSIDEIEKLSGLDFIAPLADEFETKIEAAVPGRLW